MTGKNKSEKSIAIFVRSSDREGLRMAVGSTLMDDQVTVLLVDEPFEPDDEMSVNVETLGMLNVPVYTNYAENSFSRVSDSEMASIIRNADVCIVY